MTAFKYSIGLNLAIILYVTFLWNVYAVKTHETTSISKNNEKLFSEVKVVEAEEADNEMPFKTTLLVGVLSTLIFSFIGVLPALFIKDEVSEDKFTLLSFAAGSLLADVMLHLIPEASSGSQQNQINNGLFSILTFFLFLLIDKATGLIPNAHALGTLNLIANFFDNSAHGTTIVGAFEISLKFGLVALIATMIHEIPHEFSDFVLLLKDGYTRKGAVIAQLVTAGAGTIGATLAHFLQEFYKRKSNIYTEAQNVNFSHDHHHHLHSHEHHCSFALPFTIGGFLYIALVGIVPEIVEEQNKHLSIIQLITFVAGVFFIYILVQIEHFLPAYFS